jgi:hypothetical protein
VWIFDEVKEKVLKVTEVVTKYKIQNNSRIPAFTTLGARNYCNYTET